MNLKTQFSLVAAVGLLAGCATQAPDVVTHYDDFSGARTDLMADNLLESPEQPPREVVWLNAYRVFRGRTESDYYLEVIYMARADTGFIEIGAGDTLTLVVDGERLNFSGTGSFNRRETPKRDLVQETALYRATRVQLQKIAIARRIHVQVRGTKGLVERDFAEGNFEKFRKFVTRYAL
jgi:hypothetical protein